MRSRKEIEEEAWSQSFKYKVLAEILLDIRDLLVEAKDKEKSQ